VKKLGDLGCLDVGLAQHGSDCRDGSNAFAQSSGQSIFGIRLGVSAGSGCLAAQALHSVTPRKLQMMQMNVPQLVQG
jgi:hypothetical protein